MQTDSDLLHHMPNTFVCCTHACILYSPTALRTRHIHIHAVTLHVHETVKNTQLCFAMTYHSNSQLAQNIQPLHHGTQNVKPVARTYVLPMSALNCVTLFLGDTPKSNKTVQQLAMCSAGDIINATVWIPPHHAAFVRPHFP
jgi:hypothetical protein